MIFAFPTSLQWKTLGYLQILALRKLFKANKAENREESGTNYRDSLGVFQGGWSNESSHTPSGKAPWGSNVVCNGFWPGVYHLLDQGCSPARPPGQPSWGFLVQWYRFRVSSEGEPLGQKASPCLLNLQMGDVKPFSIPLAKLMGAQSWARPGKRIRKRGSGWCF